MNKTKRIQISTKDINELISSLEMVSKDIENLRDELPFTIATQGLAFLNKQYAQTPQDENITDVNPGVVKSENGYAIISEGRDVIYAEFGTGDKGKERPHQEKSKYGLNDYNSGEHIRDVNPNNEWLASQGITSGKYWTYEKNGKINATQGVPAGMQMFKTSNYLRENMKEFLEEKASDVLSKV